MYAVEVNKFMPTGLYFASAKFSQDSYTPKKLMISAVADFLSYTEKKQNGGTFWRQCMHTGVLFADQVGLRTLKITTNT